MSCTSVRPRCSSRLTAASMLGRKSFPLLFLLPRRVKKNARYVGAASGLILAMMWFERYWLVAPTLDHPLAFGFPEIFTTAVFLGAFMFPISVRNRQLAVVAFRSTRRKPLQTCHGSSLAVSFSLITACVAFPFLFWAIRSGQFQHQDRARYLSLDCPPTETSSEAHHHGL